MKLAEVLTVLAVLLAPVVAVQVQKWLELFREDRARKRWIFKTLMATRAATAPPDHVHALNMTLRILRIWFTRQMSRW